jgi:hypothetical protein
MKQKERVNLNSSGASGNAVYVETCETATALRSHENIKKTPRQTLQGVNWTPEAESLTSFLVGPILDTVNFLIFTQPIYLKYLVTVYLSDSFREKTWNKNCIFATKA